MYEDTYRIRQLNEMRVQHETQTIDLLNKCLEESDDSTKKMTNLLNNFESRLTSLHDLIVPIYDATNTLQIKYSSNFQQLLTSFLAQFKHNLLVIKDIQTTVGKLDEILEYYNSVKNLSMVIQAG